MPTTSFAVQRRLSRMTASVVVLLMVMGLVLSTAGAAEAGTNPRFESNFQMKYRVYGATHFTVTGDGKVPVKSKATTSSKQKGYTIAIQRYSCGLFACGWSVVGSDKSYTADGAWRKRTWEIGNSSNSHRLRITKLDDGYLMNGTVRVGLD